MSDLRKNVVNITSGFLLGGLAMWSFANPGLLSPEANETLSETWMVQLAAPAPVYNLFPSNAQCLTKNGQDQIFIYPAILNITKTDDSCDRDPLLTDNSEQYSVFWM